MQYLTHVPRPPLSTFVAYLWSLRDAPAHALERIVPSGTLELVVNLYEDELRIYDAEGAAYRRHAGAAWQLPADTSINRISSTTSASSRERRRWSSCRPARALRTTTSPCATAHRSRSPEPPA